MLISDAQVVGNWVASMVGCSMPGSGATALGLVHKGKLVAGALYEDFTTASISMTVAVANNAPITREFLWAIFDYPFNQLAVEKVVSYSNSSNKASQLLQRRVGFTEEGRIKGVYVDGDEVISTLTKESCIWLKRLSHGQESKHSSRA